MQVLDRARGWSAHSINYDYYICATNEFEIIEIPIGCGILEEKYEFVKLAPSFLSSLYG